MKSASSALFHWAFINICMTKPQSPIIDTSQDAAFNGELAQSAKTQSKTFAPKLTWKADRPDSRDYRYLAPASTSGLVDLRSFCSPVEDQGNLGSCTGHAVSSAMEVILKKQNRLTEISRLFIYYQARLIEGTVQYDAGAYLRDCIKACNKTGASSERLWQYNIRQYRTNPTRSAYKDAANRKVVSYERCADFTAVRAALSNGNPVVAGFLVYTSFMSAAVVKTGIMPYPNTRTERILGGHAICLVGYDDTRQVFIAKNSWGTSWGDGGYFYMPYQVIKNSAMSGDFWVITDITR